MIIGVTALAGASVYLATGAIEPRLVAPIILSVVKGAFSAQEFWLFPNFGIAALLLTPFIRVLASMLYFAFYERNLKYSLFTLFVFTVLTYSLFLK